MDGLVLCLFALTELFGSGMSTSYQQKLARSYPDRMLVCLDIVDEALDADVPVELAVSVGFEESKFTTNVRSRAGAVGPMQVLPQFHCPNRRERDCDLVKAGVGALKRYLTRNNNDWYRAACHYNGGNVCGRYARGYGRRVKRRALRLRTMLAGARSFFDSVFEEGCDAGGEGETEQTAHWYSLYVRDNCLRCPDCCVSEEPEEGQTGDAQRNRTEGLRVATEAPCDLWITGSPLWNDCMMNNQ